MNGYESFGALAAKYPELERRGWTAEWLIRLHGIGLLAAIPSPCPHLWKYSETILLELLEFRPIERPISSPIAEKAGAAIQHFKCKNMTRGKDFLSVKQLMTLMGTSHYNTAWRRHKAIREALSPGKRALTLREYCEFEGVELCDIVEILKE